MVTAAKMFFGSLCAGTGCLGVWQVQRYFWKVDLIEQSRQKITEGVFVASTSDMLTKDGALCDSVSGRVVSLSGKFLHGDEVLLGPRAAPLGVVKVAAQGMAINPQGYFIVTPFRRDNGELLFVNRGWVSVKKMKWNRPESVQTIHGVVTKEEGGGKFAPVNDIAGKKFLWLDPIALKKATNTATYFDSIQDRTAVKSAAANVLDEDMTAPQGSSTSPKVVVIEQISDVMDGDTLSTSANKTASPSPNKPRQREPSEISVMDTAETPPAVRKLSDVYKGQSHVLPETHAVYAFTWFSLAFLGSIMTYRNFGAKKTIGKKVVEAARNQQRSS